MGTVAGTSTFTAGGDAYDAFMGRYAVLLAPLLADLAGVTAGQRALDVGCGTGALTAVLVRRLGPEQVAGCDPSPDQLTACRARCPGADLRQAAAEQLPWGDATRDVVLSQLVLHFVTDAERAAGELARVVVPGGRVAACVWDADGGMEMLGAFHDAIAVTDPEAVPSPDRMRFGRQGELSALLSRAGLTDVREEPLTVASRYQDFAELWATFSLGVGPDGTYTTQLPADRREALRAAYFERLGAPEGPLELRALARAAVGTR